MAKKAAALRPSEVFAARMRYLRKRKDWTQQDLADRLLEMGAPTDRATIARTESLARGLSLDDGVLYGAALGGALAHMVGTPTLEQGVGTPIAIAPKVTVPPGRMLQWVRGSMPLRPEDERIFFEEVSEEERLARERYHLRWVLARVQDLIDAVVNEERETAANIIDDINAALERQRRELEV